MTRRTVQVEDIKGEDRHRKGKNGSVYEIGSSFLYMM